MTYQTSVNLGESEIINFKVVEKLPPNSPFYFLSKQPNVQTTPQLARGYMPGSSIELLNNNVAHVCDFKFIFDLQSDLSFGLINPVTAIQNAIKNAKLKAANRLRYLTQDAIELFRAAIDKIIEVLNLDPSGEISFYWSLGKDIVRRINQIIEFIAEKVEIVLEWVFFAQEIKKLIEWILSLPDKIKALLAECVKNFINSIVQVAHSVQSIPEQISNLTKAQAQSIADEFTQASKLVLNSVTESQKTSGVPEVISTALSLGSTDPQHLTMVSNYIKDSVPTANSISANTTSSQFLSMKSP